MATNVFNLLKERKELITVSPESLGEFTSDDFEIIIGTGLNTLEITKPFGIAFISRLNSSGTTVNNSGYSICGQNLYTDYFFELAPGASTTSAVDNRRYPRILVWVADSSDFTSYAP